jgi:hypothetical protein
MRRGENLAMQYREVNGHGENLAMQYREINGRDENLAMQYREINGPWVGHVVIVDRSSTRGLLHEGMADTCVAGRA